MIDTVSGRKSAIERSRAQRVGACWVCAGVFFALLAGCKPDNDGAEVLAPFVPSQFIRFHDAGEGEGILETATLQHNMERAIRFEANKDSNGKPILVFDPDALEIEVFFKIRGASGDPKSISTFPASEIKVGE